MRKRLATNMSRAQRKTGKHNHVKASSKQFVGERKCSSHGLTGPNSTPFDMCTIRSRLQIQMTGDLASAIQFQKELIFVIILGGPIQIDCSIPL
jgi:hypothetical protein